jgi:hypothetical protein
MRRILLLCLLPALAAADDHWVKFTSPPFEVFSDVGPRAGRETMVRFQEFRHAVGQVLGEADLQTAQPIRILVLKNASPWIQQSALTVGRSSYNVILQDKAAVPGDVYRELTRLFLQSNTNRMPASLERGLAEFFSTFEVTGIRITVGKPPAKPDLDWARIHLLVADPDYYGKVRVLLSNLRKGVAEDAAYRNAFAKSPAEVEAQAKSHFAAGHFETTSLNSKPMAPDDFPERFVSQSDARLARADLLAGKASIAEYHALVNDGEKMAEAEEGLGLLSVTSNDPNDARTHFSRSMEAGSSSARCYIEYAKLEPDAEKARQALLKAAGINSKLAEPFALMAKRDTDSRMRAAHWKAAAEREPRNLSYWQALAETNLADHNYVEAAKAWTQAEQAASDPAEKERMHRARMSVEEQRLDYETAEKRRIAEEEARDLERLKSQARAEVHALEKKYNGGEPTTDAKAVPWWDGPKPSGKASGMLKQVDCIGGQARLVIQPPSGALVKLLILDPQKIVISGGGDQTLGCGAQKPRRLSVEYFPKTNAKLNTAGEVATIEFQ